MERFDIRGRGGDSISNRKDRRDKMPDKTDK